MIVTMNNKNGRRESRPSISGKRKYAVALITCVALVGLYASNAEAESEGVVGIAEQELAVSAGSNPVGFFRVVSKSGLLGIVLWLALAGCSIGGVTLIVDSFTSIRAKKIAPLTLVEKVRDALGQGDVFGVIQHCEAEPGPLANILSTGFSNVEEGYEAIQEAVAASAERESEKLLQRVSYLNVVGNLAPMLGLLGTVQGMIFAFATLGTVAGAASQAALALNISQALFTTAAGLCIAVPALGFFYFFRNKAMTVILDMEVMTLDLIKSLRNVEIIEE